MDKKYRRIERIELIIQRPIILCNEKTRRCEKIDTIFYLAETIIFNVKNAMRKNECIN